MSTNRSTISSSFSGTSRMHTWFTYYWLACKKFGAECYLTWRAELLASVVVAAFIYFLNVKENRAWKDFRTALLATGLTLGAFALWHLVRIPWLIHKHTGEQKGEEHWGFGILGIGVMTILLFGAYSLGTYLIEISKVSVVLSIPTPPAPQIVVVKPPLTSRATKSPTPIPHETIHNLMVEGRLICALKNPSELPNEIQALLKQPEPTYLDGELGKAYFVSDSAQYQRAEETPDAIVVQRYHLPENSDLIGQPVTRLSSYPYLTLDIWGAPSRQFTSCRNAEITMRVNGRDVFRKQFKIAQTPITTHPALDLKLTDVHLEQ